MLLHSFQARYYNGQDAHAYTVDISFASETINIIYTNNKGEKVHVIWKQPEWKEILVKSSFIELQKITGFGREQLEITDLNAIVLYKELYRKVKNKTVKNPLRRSPVLAVILGILILFGAGYFLILPAIADVFGRNFPKEYEIEMGESIYESVLAQEKIDSVKTKDINLFFQLLKVDGDYPVRITVVDKNINNAFALPGGGIVVYSKMLDQLKTPESLAALLAHEYSHIQLKHATRGLFKNLAGYMFISILFSDAGGIAGILVQNAHQLTTLSYSRAMENEADENGLKILSENGISKVGMKQLFMQLKKENNLAINEMLSTHPDLDARIKVVEDFVASDNATASRNDSLDIYFKLLKQGTDKDSSF